MYTRIEMLIYNRDDDDDIDDNDDDDEFLNIKMSNFNILKIYFNVCRKNKDTFIIEPQTID